MIRTGPPMKCSSACCWPHVPTRAPSGDLCRLYACHPGVRSLRCDRDDGSGLKAKQRAASGARDRGQGRRGHVSSFGVITQPLTQTLILLSASVAVVALTRRVGLPPILGYLIVGLALGPLSLGVISDSQATKALAEIGVVFLLFTLGLDFSWPRMVAMRREVFGLGFAQVLAVGGIGSLPIHWAGADWVQAVVAGGAVSMCSTAIVLHQLTDQSELNRTHGRLAFAVLLFQDLAFVPLLALATARRAAGPRNCAADRSPADRRCAGARDRDDRRTPAAATTVHGNRPQPAA